MGFSNISTSFKEFHRFPRDLEIFLRISGNFKTFQRILEDSKDFQKYPETLGKSKGFKEI